MTENPDRIVDARACTPPATNLDPNIPKKPQPPKSALVLKLLKRKNGATLAELCAATGWQPHSVRGHLSAVVRKRTGLTLARQPRKDGTAAYRLGS